LRAASCPWMSSRNALKAVFQSRTLRFDFAQSAPPPGGCATDEAVC
jgi:hypothetical protein